VRRAGSGARGKEQRDRTEKHIALYDSLTAQQLIKLLRLCKIERCKMKANAQADN
jgi:hypothetical protein